LIGLPGGVCHSIEKKKKAKSLLEAWLFLIVWEEESGLERNPPAEVGEARWVHV
jgi:hypothetical protein